MIMRPCVVVMDAISLDSIWSTRRLAPVLGPEVGRLLTPRPLMVQVMALLVRWAPAVRTLLRLWSSAVRAILTFRLVRTRDSRDREAMTCASSVRLTVSS